MRYAIEMCLQSVILEKRITATSGQIQLISHVLFVAHHHQGCSLPAYAVYTGPHQLFKPAVTQKIDPLFFGLHLPELKHLPRQSSGFNTDLA